MELERLSMELNIGLNGLRDSEKKLKREMDRGG